MKKCSDIDKRKISLHNKLRPMLAGDNTNLRRDLYGDCHSLGRLTVSYKITLIIQIVYIL